MNVTAKRPQFSTEEIDLIYSSVFRSSTHQPGFYYKDFGKDIDSNTFRSIMIELKKGLTKIVDERTEKRLNYQWLGRFNHQHTSGFHRDSADHHSILMLGYEPTDINSQVYLADYSKYIENKKITLKDYFGGIPEVNTVRDAHEIQPFVTELEPFSKDHFRLVVLNNSKSFEQASFGVFHKGEVQAKIEGKDRIINSIMMCLTEKEVEEQYDQDAVMNFVSTTEVNR